MLNTLVNSMIMVGEGALGLFKELFINPLNGTFSYMIEYFAAKPTIVSILGLLTSFYLFALATSAAVLLLKAGISYCIFCYNQRILNGFQFNLIIIIQGKRLRFLIINSGYPRKFVFYGLIFCMLCIKRNFVNNLSVLCTSGSCYN